MNERKLQKLDAAVAYLLGQDAFSTTIKQLNTDLAASTETFLWSTIDLNTIPCELPSEIKSGWIFHLRQDVPSGCHYHPNSIQHMIVVSGQGTSIVGNERKTMPSYASANTLADKWYVIDKNVPHEFIPAKANMTVISFHTCNADELEEIVCETGGKRLYEGTNA
ncbi:MAG: cupin domain-containing protein [Leptolyngbyaceae cyanobacterium MAG.088]|nr:cupin domain-containing protein [Leptolyngbyaceae cyanobacterium MAG.088]